MACTVIIHAKDNQCFLAFVSHVSLFGECFSSQYVLCFAHNGHTILRYCRETFPAWWTDDCFVEGRFLHPHSICCMSKAPCNIQFCFRYPVVLFCFKFDWAHDQENAPLKLLMSKLINFFRIIRMDYFKTPFLITKSNQVRDKRFS